MSCSIGRNILLSAAGMTALTAGLLAGAPAQADVTISTDTTQNVSCSGGVCQPSANNAVLNVNDLENLLASGNVEVTTTGSGGIQANNIDVAAALTWPNANMLSLVANQAIEVDQPMSVTGAGGLSITNDGQNEHFWFGSSGNVTFSNLSSSLSINGQTYQLYGSLNSLASAIENNPGGNFALAQSVRAKKGTYSQPPIYTSLDGSFEGLGNSIDHVRLRGYYGGLFLGIQTGAVIRNLGVQNADIRAHTNSGALAAVNNGYVSHCFATGTVGGGSGTYSYVGGLVGANGGTISASYATAKVIGGKGASAGGLVGVNELVSQGIQFSFATGPVAAVAGNKHRDEVGGLVGQSQGTISNSYSTGSASGGSGSDTGGLAGSTESGISSSYSTGKVSGSPYLGGFLGYDASGGALSDDYWDTDESGISNLSQGAGNISDDPGITGLTTAQFQSGLPAGFDPTVWAENPSINNGLPYLVANPPPQ